MPRAVLACLVGTALAFAPAAAQTPQDVDRFRRLLESYDYEKLIGANVLQTDQQMVPPCRDDRKIVSRQLVAITEAPRFIANREVPVAGKWLERVTVERCGRTIRHNVFLVASQVRGLHAVVGFPGESRADIDLQYQVGRQVRDVARRADRSCRQLDIVDVSQREARVPQGQPWTEIWTSWVCGILVRAEVRFQPKSGGGIDVTVR